MILLHLSLSRTVRARVMISRGPGPAPRRG
jgi:hypothetical protein